MSKMKFNAGKLKKLFDRADERILLRKKEKLEIEDGPIQQKERAVLYVDAIAELVNYTLSRANKENGKVKIPMRLKKYFGELGSGTIKTPGSYYELDDERLKIVLDYSNEYHNGSMVTWRAKSRIKYDIDNDDFSSESGRIPLDKISDALNNYGLGMKYNVGTMESEDKTILIEVEMYTIIVKRIKDKVDDSKPYIKV